MSEKMEFSLTFTNKITGNSVTYTTEKPLALLVPDHATDVVKSLVNAIRLHDSGSDGHNTCAW